MILGLNLCFLKIKVTLKQQTGQGQLEIELATLLSLEYVSIS